MSSGTSAALISLGFHCCLIFKYRYILCNCCHIFNFKVIHYLKFRWIFKFGISTPLPESLLLSLAAKDRKMAEREAREQQGKRGMRKQRVGGGTGRLHAWGKTWRALRFLELGKVRQQFTILSDHCHSCWYLRVLSRGTQLGFVLSLGT